MKADDKHLIGTEQRLVRFVTRSNWLVFAGLLAFGLFFMDIGFIWGIVGGGLLVTVNFHLLARTLKKAFCSPLRPSSALIMVKYYFRFFISGIILYMLISNHLVDPLGLIAGLSVVVASLMLATLRELGNLLFKEAV